MSLPQVKKSVYIFIPITVRPKNAQSRVTHGAIQQTSSDSTLLKWVIINLLPSYNVPRSELCSCWSLLLRIFSSPWTIKSPPQWPRPGWLPCRSSGLLFWYLAISHHLAASYGSSTSTTMLVAYMWFFHVFLQIYLIILDLLMYIWWIYDLWKKKRI